jgi:dihydrolipoamide dehydrogenase
MATKQNYDIAVIGSGPGGYAAALRASQLGFKTVCIEKNKTVGGTCLNVGCIPSKALLQSSEYYELIKNEVAEHGIEYKDLNFNFQKIMQRKDATIKGLVNGIASLFKRQKVEQMRGMAKFISAFELEVVNETETIQVQARFFIIATGSEPIALPFLPFDEKKVLSSTGALALPLVPKSMMLIGAGVIGVEIASIYRRLGTKVSIIEMLDRICAPMDLTMSKTFLQILKKQGLEFYLNAKVMKAQKNGEEVSLVINHENHEVEMKAEVALVAIGRKPFTENLRLNEIGIKMTSKGFISVDLNFRTTHPHIFAIGDVIEGPMLAHKASDEGVAAVEFVAGLKSNVNYLTIPNVIYTHPEAAWVGMTEQDALEASLDVKIGTSYFKGNPRARCTGYTEGLVKIVAEARTGRLIGMHIIGPHASEMIGEGVMAILKAMTLEEFSHASHAHPTLSETIKEAACDALEMDYSHNM